MKQLSAHTARYAITILLMGGLCLSFGRGVEAANGINKAIMFQGKVTNSNGTNVADGVYDFDFKLYNAAGGGSTLFTETWSNAALWTSTMSSAPGNGGTQLTYTTGTNETSIKIGQILWNTTKQESVIVTAVDTASNTIDISPTRQAWNTSDTVTNRIYVKDGVFRVALNSLNTDLSGVNFGTDNIFLGINFNSDGEMKPRIQYSAVPYAFNAEKVNGLTVTNTADNPFGSTTILKIGDGKTVSIANSLAFSGTDSTAFVLPSTGDTLAGLTVSQTFTNKTIGNTGLVFSGATTDVTSASNEDLTFTANGTGSLILTSDFDSGVLIGSAANTLAPLSVSGGIGENAAFILNQDLSGDIFAASQGGITKFVIKNDGNVGIGTINPLAKLDVMGDASLSGQLVFASGYGAIQTSNSETLTIGGVNTGNIALTPNNGTGLVTINGDLQLTNYTGNNSLLTVDTDGLVSKVATNSAGQCLISGTTTPTWNDCRGKVFGAYDSTGGTNISTGITVGLDTERTNTDTNIFSLSSGEVTIQDDGLYVFIYRVSATLTGGTRGAVRAFMEKDSGAGYSEIAGSRAWAYGRVTTYPEATAVGFLAFQVSAGDSFRVRALVESGTFSTVADGSSLLVYKIDTGSGIGGGGGGGGGLNYWQLNGGVLAPGDYAAAGSKLVLGGNTTTPHQFEVSGAIVGQSLVALNELGDQDIFVASQAGDTRFVLTNAGGIQLTAGQGIDTLTSGALLLGNGATTTDLTIGRSGGTINLPGFANCTALETSGGVLTCGTDDTGGGGGTNYWVLNNGALYQGNQFTDVFFGGTATDSAKFAVLNLTDPVNPPTASVSAIGATNRPGLSMAGDGVLQSLNNGRLQIGGSTTGEIILSPRNSVAGSYIAPGGNNTVDLGLSTAAFRNIYAGTSIQVGGVSVCLANGTNCSASGTSKWDTLTNGSVLVSKFASVSDLLLGGTSTSSAKFAFINTLAGTPTASVSSGLNGNNGIYLTADGAIATTNRKDLSIGNSSTYNTTGNILLNPNGFGNIGIGTTSPFKKLSVLGTSFVQGQKSGAESALIVDQLATGTGNDLFTASSAGTTRFTISNSGAITSSAYTTANGLLTTNSSGLVSQTAAGTGTDCLRGDLSWGSCGSGATGGGGDRPHAIYSAATGTNVQVEFTGAVDSAPALGATLVLPSNTSRIRVVTRGGGGGGGGVSNANAIKGAGGGGEGGYSEEIVTSLGSTYYYTVGAGGTAGTTAGGNGGTGGSTCFGTNATACTTPMLSATGGSGGVGSTGLGSRAGGDGGTGSGGNINLDGDVGDNSGTATNAIFSGGGGGNGGAAGITVSGNGVAGNTGGGGSGGVQTTTATTTRTGGAGGAGYIIIYVYTSADSTSDLWGWNNGAISPSNLNNDLLLGGVSTAAAKFAFINNMVGTPTASIAANTTNNALFITGDGSISRTNRQNLILGNSATYNSTGNILLNPNGVGNVGIGTTTPSFMLDVNGTARFTGAITVASCTGCGGGGTSNWDSIAGALRPKITTQDLLLGGTSTASAKFAVLNMANGSGQPTASIAATTANNSLFISGDGNISRTNRQNLVLGNSTTYNLTGNILLNPNGVGNVGIGLTSPSYTFDVLTPSLTTNGARGMNLSSTFAPTGGGTQQGMYLDITNNPSTTNNTAIGSYINMVDNTAIVASNNNLYGNYTNLILSGNANKNAYGAQFSLTDDSNTSGTLQGINIGVTRTGDTNGFATNTYGIRLSAQTSGAATSSTQNIFGIDVGAASQNMVSGTTNVYGIRVNNGVSSVGGSATLNYYGLYIDSQILNTTGTTTGTGLFVNSVSGADNNYAAIFAGGRIGIGTTTPLATVDIKGQKDGARAGLIIDQLATGTGSDIFTASAAGVTRFTLFNDGSASMSGGLTLGDAGVLRASTGALNFDYKSGSNTWSRGLTLLDNSGNVGIGTTSPGSKLDVEFGSAPVTDMVNINNEANGTSTTLVDGLQIDFATAGTTASADNSGLRVNVTSNNSGLTTTLTGIDIANLVSAEANATEIGLRVGTGWDRGVVIETGGSTNSGLVYSGAGRPTKTITLSPEFAGAILTASGSATITGSMTSDASASAALSNYRTYYEWTSSQTTLQDYTVALRVTLPKDFSAWATSNAIRVNYNTELTGTASNKLDVVIYNTDSSLSAQEQATPVSMRQNLSSGSVKTWTSNSIDATELDAGNNRDVDLAGETMLIYLKMYSKDDNYVQIGDIELNYLASF